jgi:hypothetical protein
MTIASMTKRRNLIETIQPSHAGRNPCRVVNMFGEELEELLSLELLSPEAALGAAEALSLELLDALMAGRLADLERLDEPDKRDSDCLRLASGEDEFLEDMRTDVSGVFSEDMLEFSLRMFIEYLNII